MCDERDKLAEVRVGESSAVKGRGAAWMFVRANNG